MSFITADDVRKADDFLLVRPGARLTPLARDLANELGVEIRHVNGPAGGAGSGARVPGRGQPGASVPAVALDDPSAPISSSNLALPPSGAMYRRGTPLAAGIDRGPDLLGASPPAATAGSSADRLKVGVVGAGHVGAMTALRLAECNLFRQVAMVDVTPGLAAGLALDMWHGSGLCRFDTRVVGDEDPTVFRDCRYIVVTAGSPRKPGMTRTDLTDVNAAVMRSVGLSIAQHAPDAVVVVVTNPLEEMTHVMQNATGFPSERVIGMAGVLDSARFRALVGLTGVAAPSRVHAYAMGSHGPEMVIPLSQATANGRPVSELIEPTTLAAIVERTRDSGAEVVGLLKTGSAYFAPAESAASMVRAMARDSNEVLTACVSSGGAYGLVDTRVGLPVRLGPDGVDEIVTLDLEPGEIQALQAAAERIAVRVAAAAEG